MFVFTSVRLSCIQVSANNKQPEDQEDSSPAVKEEEEENSLCKIFIKPYLLIPISLFNYPFSLPEVWNVSDVSQRRQSSRGERLDDKSKIFTFSIWNVKKKPSKKLAMYESSCQGSCYSNNYLVVYLVRKCQFNHVQCNTVEFGIQKWWLTKWILVKCKKMLFSGLFVGVWVIKESPESKISSVMMWKNNQKLMSTTHTSVKHYI